MMQWKRLFLVQQGEAYAGGDDTGGSLTDRGIADVTQVARYAIEQLGVQAFQVVHSARTAARETAEIWARYMRVGTKIGAGLGPNDDPLPWFERVCLEPSDFMLVGDPRNLDRIAGLLLGTSSHVGATPYSPGGFIELTRADRAWEVTLAVPSMPSTD